MGRKTYNSIGRALPNRTNIVLTRDNSVDNHAGYSFDDNTQLYWATSREEGMYVADLFSIVREMNDFFVIGGEEIYKQFDELVNRVYLTEVFGEIVGDAVFSKHFPSKEWKTISEQDFPTTAYDNHPHRFSVLERRERRYRYNYLSSFFTDQISKNEWIKRSLNIHKRKISEYETSHQEVFEF